MSTPEGRVKAKVTRWLKELGDDCWYFMPVQRGMGRPALDYECCIRGHSVAIETKVPGGVMSPTQKATRDAKLAAGGLVLMIWDEQSLEHAKRIINGIRAYASHRFTTHWYLTEEARGLYEEHLKVVLTGKAPKSSTGGDHGAPRAPPQRQSKPRSRGQDQAPPVRGDVTEDYDRDGYGEGSDGW